MRKERSQDKRLGWSIVARVDDDFYSSPHPCPRSLDPWLENEHAEHLGEDDFSNKLGNASST